MGHNNYIFCSQCGAQLPADAKFCNKCGTVINIPNVSNPENGSSFKAGEYGQGLSMSKSDEKTSGTEPLSIDGRSTTNRRNNNWYIYAIVFALLAGILKVCSNKNDEEYSSGTYSEAVDSDSNTQNSKKYSDITFYNEIDVRGYLLCHKFKSSDGTTITFKDNANQIWMNGRCLSSNIDVLQYNRTGAIFKYTGPWGSGSLAVTLENGIHAIVDLNDRTVYKEQ